MSGPTQLPNVFQGNARTTYVQFVDSAGSPYAPSSVLAWTKDPAGTISTSPAYGLGGSFIGHTTTPPSPLVAGDAYYVTLQHGTSGHWRGSIYTPDSNQEAAFEWVRYVESSQQGS